jgi:hypothetical protein
MLVIIHIINDIQIEFLINEFSKETNERITIDDLVDANLINHEYIERSFLFNKKFMQKYFNIFTIGKFG